VVVKKEEREKRAKKKSQIKRNVVEKIKQENPEKEEEKEKPKEEENIDANAEAVAVDLEKEQEKSRAVLTPNMEAISHPLQVILPQIHQVCLGQLVRVVLKDK
jgi:hypothetical protein